MPSGASVKILIVKTSAIGDVIHAFAAVDYLRAKFPTAQIDWVVESAAYSLLRAHPQLDRAIEIRTKLWRKKLFSFKTWQDIFQVVKHLRSSSYDLLFDLQGNTKSACVTFLAKARKKVGFDARAVSEKLNLLVTHQHVALTQVEDIRSKYLLLVQNYFHDTQVPKTRSVHLLLSSQEQLRLEALPLQKNNCLMVCVGSHWKNKQLAPATLKAFLDLVASHYAPFFIFIYGNPGEQLQAEVLARHFEPRSLALGHLSLPLWQALMWRCKGVIAVDSAALHLAATTETPTFSIFGPSLASFYKPPGTQHVAIQGPCPYGRHFPQRCPVLRTCPTGACVKNLDPQELFRQFQQSRLGK